MEIPDVKSKLEEIEREVQRIEEEITEVRHITSLNYEDNVIDHHSYVHNQIWLIRNWF